MTSTWIKAAFTRAIKTIAQSAIALIGTSQLVTQLDWDVIASGAGLAGLLSLLTSVAGLPEVPEGDNPADNAGGDRGQTNWGGGLSLLFGLIVLIIILRVLKLI